MSKIYLIASVDSDIHILCHLSASISQLQAVWVRWHSVYQFVDNVVGLSHTSPPFSCRFRSMVCTYEPVLTKSFYHGRTEAMRSATTEAKHLCSIFFSSKIPADLKVAALRNATAVHSQLVKECARGKGVDRHLFALKCIAERNNMKMPRFFNSEPWKALNHTVLSTSNCGNPALAFFGDWLHYQGHLYPLFHLQQASTNQTLCYCS